MRITTKARVLTALSKAYNIGGNEGISHKVRVLVDSEIFNCKADEVLVEKFVHLVGKDVKVELDFISPKENVAVVLLSLVE